MNSDELKMGILIGIILSIAIIGIFAIIMERTNINSIEKRAVELNWEHIKIIILFI